MIDLANQEQVQRAMVAGLENAFREALRDKYEMLAQEIIEEAVETSMNSFERTLNSYRDLAFDKSIVEVILRDKRSKDNS